MPSSNDLNSRSLSLSVVIPFFNEAGTLEQIVDRVAKVDFRKEMILVDDGSTDRSGEIGSALIEKYAQDSRNKLTLLSHQSNLGKGAALKTAFEKVNNDIVIIQDADLEYDPADYLKLVKPIVDGQADVVFGSRFSKNGAGRPSLWPVRFWKYRYWHLAGNRFLTGLSNLFTNLQLTDIETCYKVFRREVIDEIGGLLQRRGFGVEPEITARIARRRYRVVEVPIGYSARTYAEGKKINLGDGFKAVWCIVRYGLAD